MFLRIWPDDTHLNFMSARYIALAASVTALLLSAIMLSSRGLNFGIDFAGGSVIEIVQPEGTTPDDIRAVVVPLDLGDVSINSARGTGAAAEDLAVIRFETQVPAAGEDIEAAQQNDSRLYDYVWPQCSIQPAGRFSGLLQPLRRRLQGCGQQIQCELDTGGAVHL